MLTSTASRQQDANGEQEYSDEQRVQLHEVAVAGASMRLGALKSFPLALPGTGLDTMSINRSLTVTDVALIGRLWASSCLGATSL